MKTINKLTLIGAGGTGSMVLPALVPTCDVEIWDGDEYEDRNITRQIYSKDGIGANKATTLAAVFNGGHKNVTAKPHMVKGNEDLDTDLILCCVDNNAARLAAQSLSDKHDVPLIVCGNEVWEPMAWLYLPKFKYTNKDPYTRHDLGNLTEGRQETCAGVEIIEENEQMPGANFCAGAHAITIMNSLVTCHNEDNYLAEAFSTPNPRWATLKQIDLHDS